MAIIDRETIDKILDAAEIVDVVSDFISLKRRGANYMACCPFHNEKTPSFSVSPTKGIFKCFGCGKAGSAVTFVMEHEHLSYTDALKYLGKKYGIEVHEKEETEEDAQDRLRHESLIIVSEFAQKFFTDTMYNTEVGRAVALSYFKEARGFSDETIKRFGLGYSPDLRKNEGGGRMQTLAQAAQKAGYKREFLIGTGLCIERNDGTLVDKFYDRVMFPIHSISGRVIAFGGRTLLSDKSVAKYVNSPETEIYHKSSVLYGIYQAKNAIAKQQKCYLVEGYADVISMHQAGVENVVASSGTSLTQGQIRLIKRFANRVTVLYDGDAAGIKASLRGIDMLLEEGMEVKVALIPDGHDPDDFARSHSFDEIIEFLNEAESDFIDFKYELLSKDIAKDPIRKAELIREIVRTISLIPDQIMRTVYIEQSALKLDVKQEMLTHEVNKARRDFIVSGEYEKKREQQRALNSSSYTKDEGFRKVELDIEYPFLDTYEKELLYYLLKFGDTLIHFDEHRYVDSEEPIVDITVSQYISSELERDDLVFQNTLYKRIYDLYFESVNEGLNSQQIFRRMTTGPEEAMAKVVLDITLDEYNISIKKFKEAMVPEEQMLDIFVPKAVVVYKSKITDMAYNSVTQQLGQAQIDGDIDLQLQLMQQIKILMMVKNQFSKELNRLM